MYHIKMSLDGASDIIGRAILDGIPTRMMYRASEAMEMLQDKDPNLADLVASDHHSSLETRITLKTRGTRITVSAGIP